MREIDFYIVDVFAKKKYQGNQLAVYLDLDNQLDVDDMLRIAKEINFAESTFIKNKIDNNQFEVRIFTTESEIPFAGHPTIGTSFIIAKYLMHQPDKEIIIKLSDRKIKVELLNTDNLEDCLFKMTQSSPLFLKKFNASELSAQLGIDQSLIDENLPIQEISTGLPFIIIPIKNLAGMEQIRLDSSKFKKFLIDHKIYKSNNPSQLSTSLFFFVKDTYETQNDYNVRMFCIEDDELKEDSATGSANGCFLAYLLKYVNKEVKVKIEQGFQMNRKSYLFLDGQRIDETYEIKVGGYSKMVSNGKWII